MNDEQFKDMTSRMDLIIRLLALNIVKDFDSQKKKIIALSSFGFEPKEISQYLGTSSNTVRVALSRARTEKSKS